MNTQPKTNFVIEATHAGYGVVTFTIPALDARDAFNLWKQIVSAPRQWIVRRNDTGTASAVPARGQSLAEIDNI